VAQVDGSTPQLQKADPLLALKMRTGVVPEGVVNAITTVFRPLYWPPVVLAVLASFLALCGWLFLFHGVAQSLRQTLYDPKFILLLLGLVILSAAFHECGHATACRYGGARPGVMGVGIYIVWPAFYTDVTDAYRLGKAGRLRTDLGGVYFNSIFTLGTFAAYFLTGWEPLLLIVPLQIMEILHQFLPFLRLDGYYIVSDLTGVPDMFARIKPTLASLLPARETPDEVKVLKPWVRVATTLYVLTFVPLLLLFLALTVINVPRIVATAYDSFFVQLHKLGEGSALGDVVGVIQMVVLVLPVAGIVYTLWKLGWKALVGGWRGTTGRPVLRSANVAAAAAAFAGVGWMWAPNGEYRPIQPGERGTLQGAVHELGAIPTGRPGLTRERQHELGGAPRQSEQQTGNAPSQAPSDKTSTTQTTTSESRTVSTDTTSTTTSTTDTSTTSTATTSTSTTPTTTATTPTTP
jgi:putative peptide zinc metalloprotease protein